MDLSRIAPLVDSPRPIPAKAVLALRRIPNRRVAEAYGCTDHYVSRVLNGLEKSSPRFRLLLVDYLGIAEEDLFGETTTATPGAA